MKTIINYIGAGTHQERIMNTNNTISEETIASIVDAAQNIASDSTAMRQNLVAIAEGLQPMIQTAGIEFCHCRDSWVDGNFFDGTIKSLEVSRGYADRWSLHLSKGVQEHGNVVEWQVCRFENVSRNDLEEIYVRLPAFLAAYSEELERRQLRYADIRKKTTAIKEIVEG